jgi:CubicO group peptidase (beta-lactamase class C family)
MQNFWSSIFNYLVNLIINHFKEAYDKNYPKIRMVLINFFALFLWGPATAQNPCEGRGACDALLINKGRPWDYKISSLELPRILATQVPDLKEKQILESLITVFNASTIKGIALLNGEKIIHFALKDNIPEDAMFYGLSVGKTVTAIAAGQAICRKLIDLNSKVVDVLPEFSNLDIGNASLKDLLKMSSGTWEGLRDANVATQDQFREIWSGRLSIRDLMLQTKVNTAEKELFGKSRQPGSVFAYRNSDPEMVALMIAKVTGMPFSNWVEQSVLKAIPIAGPGILRTDRHQNSFASGAVQLTLMDWARFAVWVRDAYDGEDCLGNFLRESTKPQISARGPNGPFMQFNHYGYFTWVGHKMVPDSFYAHGVGGQIVAWNKRNKRIMVVFSNESPANELGAIYRDWSKLP